MTSDKAGLQTIILADEAASLQFGEDLASCLRLHDCILLEGTLGMGKTTIARALIRAFLKDDCAEVPSPTFTLANLYENTRAPLTHFDLYRLSDPDDLHEIGFYESLETGITLVEWPERAANDMPVDALRLKITPFQAGRKISVTGSQKWQRRLERNRTIRQFLHIAGWSDAKRRFLQGDASARSYELVRHQDGTKAVLMDNPALEEGPENEERRRYNARAHLAEDVRPFVAIGEALRAADLPAPELYAYDLENGLLLMEDFGQETVIKNGKAEIARYQLAIDILAQMHAREWPEKTQLPDGSHYTLAQFDDSVILSEISLLREWYAPKIAQTDVSDAAWDNYFVLWQSLFSQLSQGEKSWLLRDYHSPNLMWRAEQDGLNRLGLIDYQDALIGPSAYDVASLCQDARIDISETMERSLKTRYIKARHLQKKPFDEDGFERDYAIIAAERATRLLGLWPRLNYRDHKPHYMKHMPRTKDYLQRALKHPLLAPLKDWYHKNLAL